MTDALKLCPFCGSDHVRINGGSNSSYVECLECGVEGPFSDFTEAQAASAWNRRHVAVTDEMKLRAWRAATRACLNESGRYIAPVSADEWDRALTAALTAALSGDADD